jgi:tetratricopeptide (TPR) repeat protein
MLTAGSGLMALEQYDRSEVTLARALELWPGHPRVLALLFQLYVLREDGPKARNYATLALQANPKDARLYYRVGLFWAAEQDLPRAAETLRQALSLEPGFQPAAEKLAQVNQLLGHTAR